MKDVSQECFCCEGLRAEKGSLCTCAFVGGLAEIADEGVIACESDFSVVFFNKGASNILGYSIAEACQMTLGLMFSRATMELCAKTAEALSPPLGSMVIPENDDLLYAVRSDGANIPVSISVSAIEQNSQRMYTFLIRDIRPLLQAESRLKESLHEKDLLLKEVHHRVKNNLQVISSLLNLQSRHAPDQTSITVIRESQNRIKAIALIYEMLYQSSAMPDLDFGRYIQKLAGSLLRSYGASSRIEVRFELEAVCLGVEDAVPAGLILNELMSNCIQHGFPDPRSGLMTITLSKEPEMLFKLCVRDYGRGFSNLEVFREGTTLGSRLVVSLVNQLGGQLKAYNDGGAVVEIWCQKTASP